VYTIADRYSTANATCECNIYWHFHPTRRMSHSPISSAHLRDIRVPQAVKDVSSSYDALVDLFAPFEKFLSRLGIYTEIPLTQALKTVLVEIIEQLLSTLALATKQVKQGRFSEFVLAGCYNNSLNRTQRNL
jgi:hypothetical protein